MNHVKYLEIKYQWITMDNKSCSKVAHHFSCNICDYSTCKTSSWKKHISTLKHKRITMDNKSCSNVIKSCSTKSFACSCGKSYAYLSGLSKHKQKCNLLEKIIPKQTDKNVVIQESSNTDQKLIIDLQKMVITQSQQISELIPKVGNNNNNKFNINIFLNETCKDALSIQDFVKSLELNLKHLEYSKNNGAVDGVLNILKEGLNDLDVERRPIHCTDVKRETLYIKDTDNGWEKDDKENTKIRTAIQGVQKKQGHLIETWKIENPNWINESGKQDEYHTIVQTLLKDVDNKKIKKNIAKETELNKGKDD